MHKLGCFSKGYFVVYCNKSDENMRFKPGVKSGLDEERRRPAILNTNVFHILLFGAKIFLFSKDADENLVFTLTR